MDTDVVCKVYAITLTILLLLQECSAWPEGTYGLPMPKAGCPSTKDFEWLTGLRTQKTEPESHASTPIHLAGVESEQTDRVVQNFCMKTSYPKKGDYEWGKGNYCIFKKGDCPSGFKSGWIYWDDAASRFFSDTIQNLSGTVPDGEFDYNTKIEFCCRRDGFVTRPIVLPTDAPFYLFKIGDACQEVKDMSVAEEWVYWADEEFINLSGEKGVHPKLHRSKYPIKFTKLYYCYYVPVEAVKSRQTLIIIYCVSSVVVALILFFLVIILIQCIPWAAHSRCCRRRSKKSESYIIPESEDAADEVMMDTQTEPTCPLSSVSAHDTEMTAVSDLRRNGAANRDNELDHYPETSPRVVNPPRYSQLDNTGPPGPMTSMLGEDRRCTLPPSYEDVMGEHMEQKV